MPRFDSDGSHSDAPKNWRAFDRACVGPKVVHLTAVEDPKGFTSYSSCWGTQWLHKMPVQIPRQ